MRKLFFLLSLMAFASCGQQSSTSESGTTTLSGKGKLGGITDQIAVKPFKDTVTAYFAYDALFKKVTDKRAGVGISIRNVKKDSINNTDGKLQAVHVVLRNDSILIFKRAVYGQALTTLFRAKNYFVPYYLKVVVNYNKLEVFGTKRSDGKQLLKIFQKDSVFLGWKYRQPNIIYPVFSNITKAEIALVKYTAINNDPIGGGVVPPDPGTVLASITNVAKQISYQTAINYLPLDSIGTFTIPTYTNAQGYVRPKWGVWFNFMGQYFKDFRSIKYWQVGIMGNSNLNPSFALGSGLRGDDFIYAYDPNLGIPWEDDIDPEVGQSYHYFVSSIPYYYRFNENQLPSHLHFADMGFAGSYDFGKAITQEAGFGFGDNISGKTHRGMVAIDVEDGSQIGNEYHRAALIGMAENTTGDVSSDYGGIFNSLGYIHKLDDPTQKVTKYYPNESGTYSSDTDISEDWRADTPLLTISSKGVFNKRPIDYPNIIPSNEISFYSIEWAKQDSVYNLGGGNSIVVNKYGTNRNVEHFFARAGALLEWEAWYCRYKLSNRRNKMLTKVIADKGNIGLPDFVRLENGSFVPDADSTRKAQMCGREKAFDLATITYMNSVDLHLWDANSYAGDKNHDTYLGWFAGVKMVTTNGAQYYTEMIPQYWQTEQSYDHSTWVKHKAVDWADSSGILPCRTKVGPNKLEAMCWRPEGIEPTDVWLRATVGGVVREIHIQSSSWETVNPLYKNTPKSSIPISEKDYFYQIITY